MDIANKKLNEGQFNAECYCCNKNFIAEGMLGGHTVCDKCYPIWFKGIECKNKETNKLKEEMKFFKDICDDLPFCDGYTPREALEKLKEENEEKDKKIEELEEQNMKIKIIFDNSKMVTLCFTMDNVIEKQKKENDELKKDNKINYQDNKKLYDDVQYFKKESEIQRNGGETNLKKIFELQKEIKKLKAQKESVEAHAGMIFYEDGFAVGSQDTNYIDEIEKLKEEIVNIAKMKNKQIKKEKYKYESMCSEQAESDCSKYIQELEKENDNVPPPP
jgi:hypothetical protein